MSEVTKTEQVFVQIGPNSAPEEPTAAPEMARPHNGSFSFDGSTGQTTNRQQVFVSASDMLGGAGSGLLGTARTPWGSPTSDIKADTVLDIEGMPTPVAVAERLGYVTRDANGRYVEVSAEQRAQAEQREQEERQANAPQDQQEPFAPEHEAALVELAGDTPPALLGQAMFGIAMQVAEGRDASPNLVEELASQTGMTTDQAQKFFGASLALFAHQAGTELQQAGIAPETFYAWARENAMGELKDAAAQHVMARSLSGYRSLAQTYLRSNPPSAEVLNQAGYETRVDQTSKTLLVKIGDTWRSVKEATRQGLLYKGAR